MPVFDHLQYAKMKEEGMVERPGIPLLNEIFVCANKPGKVGLEEKISLISIFIFYLAMQPHTQVPPSFPSLAVQKQERVEREPGNEAINNVYTVCAARPVLIACSMQKQRKSL